MLAGRNSSRDEFAPSFPYAVPVGWYLLQADVLNTLASARILWIVIVWTGRKFSFSRRALGLTRDSYDFCGCDSPVVSCFDSKPASQRGREFGLRPELIVQFQARLYSRHRAVLNATKVSSNMRHDKPPCN